MSLSGFFVGLGRVLEAACTPHAASVSFSGSFAGLGRCLRRRLQYTLPHLAFRLRSQDGEGVRGGVWGKILPWVVGDVAADKEGGPLALVVVVVVIGVPFSSSPPCLLRKLPTSLVGGERPGGGSSFVKRQRRWWVGCALSILALCLLIVND